MQGTSRTLQVNFQNVSLLLVDFFPFFFAKLYGGSPHFKLKKNRRIASLDLFNTMAMRGTSSSNSNR